ncbi:MAG: ABC transporter ATP-binding protein [Caldilineaceae bacterium]|nr:ABC transporter ATP-binding protein [Caldilineaceae bacterium]MBP8107089.1 ABC transporter ATP-binding protein [Caldilineaceae bacterium]MBP8124683.1 ABC transporter ATP-binding protein [Caldilineaceae bacterium]MBP9072608.1 ABC transporter ATP-binding protein [Caldilineaceae bacterium]
MSDIRKLWPFILPYRKRAIGALFLLTALVFMDLSIPRLIQRIIDQGIRQQNQTVVLQTAALMLGISVVSTLFAIGNNNLSVWVGESVARDLREAIFLKIQSFSFGNMDRLPTGQLMVYLSSDTGAVQRLVQVSLRIGTRAPLLMVGSLILMFRTSPTLALSIVPLLLITSVIVVLFVIKTEPLFLLVQQKLDRLNTVLQENVAGARLVKAFVRADYEGKRFEETNEAYTATSVRVMRIITNMSPALTIFVNIGMVMVIWSGGLQSIRGDMTVGEIVAFTNYLLTTMTPLIMMTMLSNVWAAGLASARRVNDVLDVVPLVQDAPGALALGDEAAGRVVFENVSFRYNDDGNGGGGENVLIGINLVAEPGQTVAILGATGAGKSTLINLVPRFYDASAGRVLVDGVDVRQIDHDSLLAQVGIVPQETILFSGTVADNIRYGSPESGDDAVVAAAQAAQAHDFIVQLPDGYETHVEQRGVNLSGGQKQRIAIARALLTQPKILILDDSTSAVDVETETRIQSALDGQARRHTSLVVAQRISTVLKADKIVVLDKGRLVAEGTHRELLQTSPIYQEIYESQLGSGARQNGNGHQAAEVSV